MAYPEGLLVPGERVLVHRRPHVRMLVVPVLLAPLLALLVGWAAAATSMLSWRSTAWTVLVVVAVAVGCWFGLAPLLRWRCTHFVVTDRRVLVREGVVSRTGISVPASTVTAVHLRQTMADRVLRCGTLLVAVDGAHEPWEFDGLGDVARTAAVLQQVAIDRDAPFDLDSDDRFEDDGFADDGFDDEDLDEADARGELDRAPEHRPKLGRPGAVAALPPGRRR